MRLALFATVLALSGCQLYFNGPEGDDGGGSGSQTWLPDSGPHPDTSGGERMIRCEDNKLYRTSWDQFDQAPHGAGTQIGSCPNGCKSASLLCEGSSCPSGQALCTAPPSTGKQSLLQGSYCTGTATIESPQSTTCGYSVPGSTCTCAGGTYSCTPRTDIATVQTTMVGKWRGTVRPPSFSQPYEVSLWIYPDGSYWGECSGGAGGGAACSTFYYGGDAPHPWRKISVLSTSATAGAWADIGQFQDFNTGAISALIATSTKLTFTYNASWHNCGQPFYFDLTRE